MNKKIMDLIDLAMQFKGELNASVEFGSHINGVTVYVLKSDCNDYDSIYRKVCYLEYENADERLDSMKAEFEKYLKESLKEVV